HRAFCPHRRRSGQRDHVPEPIPHAPRRRPVRPRARGSVFARVLPDHPAIQLHLLHRDDCLADGGREMKLPRLTFGASGRLTAPCAPNPRPSRVLFFAYLVASLVPIYWLVCMSLKTNEELLGGFSLFPRAPTLDNFRVIFTDPEWRNGYVNSI